MLRRVALVRTTVSEELSASIITVTRFGELEERLIVTSNRSSLRRNTNLVTLMMDTIGSSETPDISLLRSVLGLLVTANVVPSSPILVTLMMEAIPFSNTSVLTRAKRRNIPEDDILHSRRRGKLKSYIALTGCAL
jgi:hypothetical protein